MNKPRLTLLIVLGLLLISACSGTDASSVDTTTTQPTITTTTTTTTISGSQLSAEPIPPPELDADLTGDDLLVALEARWMCDRQRFVFSDLSAIDAALSERLSAHDLTEADYQAFAEKLESQVELRRQVLEEYSAYCDALPSD